MNFNEFDWDAIEVLSRRIEKDEGWDSLTTMRTNYPVGAKPGVAICPFPNCGFRSSDPRRMFKHVHFGPHGNSYDMTLARFNQEATANAGR